MLEHLVLHCLSDKFSGVLAARQHICPFVGIGTDLPLATSIYMKINLSCLSSETGIV